ncbi:MULTISPECIES: threonine-phosphate decarboxylase CobD [Cetobacterium]|uniref:threonine-phosphate decarboxylase CobD n=1 Tax=Cetobacterium TaxID=180162 RepID=UPI00163CDE26|nr:MULTISPECIES: threonine-phosphate decarboxylase CobD [Cetobacterium]MBC2854802.1 threonine-phosphate decarboxylase [Cetobacterium sp. 2G large]MCQ8213000.1 threonine-phosphate decarboxylase CobD [Cetobacterium sp. NK01]MCQ9627669.1 threonine-phosphate decarboxylase [Cetobacterium somerae]
MDLHGGNIYKLKRDNGIEVLDYSSNINPLGVPNSFKKAVIENFETLEKYPDIDYVELRTAIGDYNNCHIDNVVVGNGATEVLFLYMKAVKAKKVLIIAPTFAEYERAARAAGRDVKFFPLSKDFSLNENMLLEFITDEDVVVMCNPNNPTGKFQNLEKIKKIADFLERKNKKLFIDEAFIEFVDDWKDKTAFLLKHKNIFILRALTKFFALPGVRLGYGLTYDESILDEIKNIREPWSVNGVAEIAGKTMLLDTLYIHETENWIKKEKLWFYEELCKIDNIEVTPTETNFILVKLLNDNAKSFRKKMIENGVLVRDASNFMFLDESYIRLAIKDRKKNEQVLEALRRVLK